ncbi:MAG: T9SS type A sorting domain-containing protein [Bacteroidales bacterium]|nr:T9SS type A sorting domain-containing protein [Bacteroidales bacterium]
MKKLLLLSAAILMICRFSFGQTYFSESFEGTWSGTLPAPSGWVQTHPTGSDIETWEKSVWTTVWTPAGNGTRPTGTPYGTAVAHFNDYNSSTGNVFRLETGDIDLSSSIDPRISFNYFYSSGSAVLRVWASSNGGSTWTNVSGSIAAPGAAWTKMAYNMAVYNVSNARIALEVTSAYGSHDLWVDNVIIDETPLPLSGIYTIDPAGSGSTNFTTFSAAINALNEGGISGAVTFNVAAGAVFNEKPSAITATGTSTNTITFQKNGVGTNPKLAPTGLLSSSPYDFGFCISGGDYITFDGIDVDASAATSITNAIEYGYLIRNASATNGAQYNTIKNCSITLNKNYIATTGGPGSCILSTVNSTGGGVVPTNVSGANSYNKYYNLNLQNAQNGVYLMGNTSYPDLACEIGVAGTGCQALRNNITNMGGIYTFNSAYGIYTSGLSGVKIFNNDITNIRSNQSTTAGILCSTYLGTSEIYNNKVSDISNSGSTTSTSRAAGIEVQNSSGTPTIRVYNNFVSDIKSPFTGTATANVYAYGIYANNTSTATVAEIDNNSVHLFTTGTPTYSLACFAISNASTAVHKVRGNVFVNAVGAQGATARHTCWYSTSATAIGGSGSVSNYNDMFIKNDAGTSGFVGRGNTTYYNTVANWTTATTQDVNTVSIDPAYTGNTNLHASAAGINAVAGFTPQAWVTTDIDCQDRSTMSPADMGADAFNLNTLDMSAFALASPLSTGCYTSSESVSITIKNNGTETVDFTVNPVTVTTNVTGAATQSLSAVVNTGSLAAGLTQDVVMTTTLDMTNAGTYTFNAYTTVSGDGNTGNDAMSPATRTVIAPVALPHIQDFDASTNPPAGWNTTGWTIGTTHANPATGNGLYKNLWSSAPSGQIILPKLGPVSSTDVFAFDYRLIAYTSYPATALPNSPAWGSIVVEISTNCGASYSTLATIDATNHVSTVNWANMSYPLSAYAGQNILLRFNAAWLAGDYYLDIDNIKVLTPPTIDMGATTLLNPSGTGCYGSSETVSVTIKNYSGSLIDFSVNQVDITCNVTGAATQSLSASLTTGTLAAGSTMNVDMSTTLNMSSAGTYTFNASTTVVGDGTPGNNAMAPATRTVTAALVAPYIQVFDGSTSAPAGWTTTGWSIGATHANPSSGYGLYKNLYSTYPTGQFSMPKIEGLSSNSALIFDYRIIDYTSYPTTATANSPSWGSINIEVSTDCGTTFATFATIDPTNHISTISWATTLYPLSAYAGQSIIIRFNATWASGDYYVDFDNFKIDELPSCIAPNSLTVSNITSVGADLGWSSPDSFFDIFIEASGAPAPGAETTPTIDNIEGTSYTWSDGVPSTTYQFYVRTDCGKDNTDVSTWAGPYTFATLCEVFEVPFTQNFDGVTIPAIPTCWTVQTGTVAWRTTDERGTSQPAAHSPYNCMSTFYNGTYAKNDWFFTPGIIMTAGETYKLSFWYLTDGGTYGPEKMEVKYGNVPNAAGMTAGVIWNNTNMINATYQQAVAYFTPSTTDVYYLGWHAYSAADIDFIAVDDIAITMTPSSTTWTGTLSSNWDVDNNWNNGIPGPNTDVIIPGGLTNYPTLTAAGWCRNFTIQSNASGTGSILGNNFLTISGTTTIERYLTKYEAVPDFMFHFLSSPVSGQAIVPEFKTLSSTNTDFYKWGESSNLWINTLSAPGTWNTSFENNFVVGNGYMVAYPVDLTKHFTGVMNNGDVSPALSHTPAASAGWNLIGNPYPSAIDWDFVSASQYTSLDNAVYVWDNANQNYLTWVGNAGSLVEGIIPSMQGFFVKANAASPALTLQNADRVHGGSAFYKNSGIVENLLHLRIDGNAHHDDAFIRFNDAATVGFDSEWDAYKLSSGVSVPKFYSNSNDTKYSVNTMPNSNLNSPVSLNLEVGADAEYTVRMIENTLSADIYVTLEDIKTGTMQRLNNNPSYTFTAGTNDDAGRFRLHFKDATSVEEPGVLNGVTVYASDGIINVLNENPLSGKVLVTDMAGRTITTANMVAGSPTRIDFRNHTGVYIVSVITSAGTVNHKILVK